MLAREIAFPGPSEASPSPSSTINTARRTGSTVRRLSSPLVLDVAGDSLAQAEIERHATGASTRRCELSDAGSSSHSPQYRWLAWLRPSVRDRLRGFRMSRGGPYRCHGTVKEGSSDLFRYSVTINVCVDDCRWCISLVCWSMRRVGGYPFGRCSSPERCAEALDALGSGCAHVNHLFTTVPARG